MSTAEETILSFLQQREKIIHRINGEDGVDDSDVCFNCPRLQVLEFQPKKKFTGITISCYPSVCQAKCIYCGVYVNPQNTYEKAEYSLYPRMISEIIEYLKNNDLLDDNCFFSLAPAEITITPFKELLLDTIKGYSALFATNGFIFDKQIAESMKNDNSIVYVSIDSGTPETFKLIKGCDMFDVVVNNLKCYRQNGKVMLKYNVIPGINDGDNDYNGVIDLIKSLGLDSLCLSREYYIPRRSVIYPILQLSKKLKDNGLSVRFHAECFPQDFDDYIQKLYSHKDLMLLEQKSNKLFNVYKNRFINDYKAYKKHLYIDEIKCLIKHFKDDTRFALLGYISQEQYIIEAFRELGTFLLTPDLSYEESYDVVKDMADIFLIRNSNRYDIVKKYISNNGTNSMCLCDVESYYSSLETTEMFLSKNIAYKHINSET